MSSKTISLSAAAIVAVGVAGYLSLRAVTGLGTPRDESQTKRLEHLFDTELYFTSDSPKDVAVPADNREGDFLGNGEGTLTGGKIQGKMRWSWYAASCAYLLVKQGKEVPPGQDLCYENPGGYIVTNDGATIKFDARGYGLRGYDESKPHWWNITMALQFSTEDERYKWLNTRFGVMEGRFDEKAGRARHRVYIQVIE
ncbi:MAG: DUF3237 family protein [bacterium]